MSRASLRTGVLLVLPVVLPLLAGACEGQVGSPAGGSGASTGGIPSGSGGSSSGSGGSLGAGSGGAGTGATPGTGGSPLPGSGGTSGSGGATALDCSQPRASIVPLRLLTESQYDNSIVDLFQVAGNPAKGIGQGVDDVSLEQRATIAASVATQAVANLAKWAPCTPPATGPSATCEQQIIDKIGPRAYRRPLTDADRADMKKLFDAGVKETNSFTTGVEWFLTGLLQSPNFAYQVVRPASGEKSGEVRPLGAYEYASRLAYFIWDGPPDDMLTAAAANNELADATKRDAQVMRMMQDARFSRGVAQFYTRWLNLNGFREVARDVDTFDDSVVSALQTSLLMSATELYKSAAPNISGLFSGDSYYLNDVLRKFYGVSGSGTAFTATSMAGQQRRGILTHPGLMALLARPNETHPIGRGLFLLRNVACQNIEAPPPGLVIPEQPPIQDGVSTRERLEMHTASAVCQACHNKINPAGFVFESFDNVGRYRTMDHGRPVVTSGTLTLGKDIDGSFDNGDVFLGRLAQSQAVRACFAEKYVDFALAHAVTDSADLCSIQAVGKSFSSSGDLKQLVVSIAGTDSFRMRLAQGVGQ